MVLVSWAIDGRGARCGQLSWRSCPQTLCGSDRDLDERRHALVGARPPPPLIGSCVASCSHVCLPFTLLNCCLTTFTLCATPNDTCRCGLDVNSAGLHPHRNATSSCRLMRCDEFALRLNVKTCSQRAQGHTNAESSPLQSGNNQQCSTTKRHSAQITTNYLRCTRPAGAAANETRRSPAPEPSPAASALSAKP